MLASPTIEKSKRVKLTRDMIGSTGGADWSNCYRAYRSNPVINLDPLGLQATTQPHNPATCPTCNNSNAARDNAAATVVDETANNATNCIDWAMGGAAGPAFGVSLGLGAKAFEKMLDSHKYKGGRGPGEYVGGQRIQEHLDNVIPGKYGGKRLSGPDDECPCGTHKIAVYVRTFPAAPSSWFSVTPTHDVHMITQHTDGTWSGKPSYDKPVVPESPSDVAAYPRTYSLQVIGYYCVKGPPRCK